MTITEHQRKLLSSQEYRVYGGVSKAARELGISYYDAYFEIRLRQRGYNSWTDYEHAKQARHSKERKYILLSRIIRRALKKLKKNQNWLANVTKESRQIISNYIAEKSFPQKEEVKRKIEKALGLKRKCLEELLS